MILKGQPSSEGAIGTGRAKSSRCILVATAATTLAYALALAIAASIGARHADWISPPIAACGLVGCLIAVISRRQPRNLALGMLGLNLVYWFCFCLILASRI
jgi:hypothetical protein